MEKKTTLKDDVRAKYKSLGYGDSWIDKRLEQIEVHKELVALWNKRGIKSPTEYAQLIDTILLTWSGHTTREYKMFKLLKLDKEDLHDNMNSAELHFATLAEKETLDIMKSIKRQKKMGFEVNKGFALTGAKKAARARQKYEDKHGTNVVKGENFREFMEKKTTAAPPLQGEEKPPASQ